GNDKGELPKAFHKHGPLNLMLDRLDERSEKEKLEFLNLHKLRISHEISRLTTTLQKIEDIIKQLETNKLG
ncbi:MAG: hypothetical protein ACW99A_20275, partial [Candidatus Kariarchaeaceae archaeon]